MKVTDKAQLMRVLIVEDQFVESHDLQLIVEKGGYHVTGIARSAVQAIELVSQDKPDLVLLDIFLKGSETGIDIAKKLREMDIGYIFISANSSKDILDEAKKTQPYGFIVKPFREQDVLTTLEIASYRHKHSLESKLRQEETLKKILGNLALQPLKKEDYLIRFGAALQSYFSFDYLEMATINGKEFNTLGLLRKNFEEYQIITGEKLSKISGHSLSSLMQMQSSMLKNHDGELYNKSAAVKADPVFGYRQVVMQNFGIRSFVSVSVALDETPIDFCFYSRQPSGFEEEHFALLKNLKPDLLKIARARIKEKPLSGKDEKNKSEVHTSSGFHNMIGKSEGMFRVFDYIKRVASSETSVLILGESGTGKEKVAKSIHNLSERRNKPLVIINCGAIPENLSESLLFGHEKGAFTGALERRIGKFEQAQGGTIFLDEIGEMPNEMQIKLLRVLQEKEIERVGGSAPQKVDIRIIAATNRNLEEEVAAGRFRLDLYYRLHVFPITIPSLRERKDDIAALAHHFVKEFCMIMNRPLMSLSAETIYDMTNYHWPGNIRELEHSIHRSILLTDGEVISEIMLSNSQKQESHQNNESVSLKTIQENERDYITFILNKCKGKISGNGGAAEILNIPPSTLNSRMKKLGITNA